MTDKVVSLRGGQPPVEEGDPWAAAVAVALKAGAMSGVVIYGTADGVGFQAINCAPWMVRGLMEEGLESFQGMGESS